ncbi:deaminase domain-containing protein [Paenibacillus sp. DCT19]|uniref:deaminase domain-containing protein n=1 Tax=Paenibacillus sp. DCT19 TaxID=2211212 RepID=UPI0020C463A0|nr:deaminase domain-containing protein [Paenibacillus sp. DCT19]
MIDLLLCFLGMKSSLNVQKLNDLKNGNAYSNPTFLGMDQKMLDDLGVALMFVNLAILAKHGLNKAADKLINSKNMSALDNNWTAWKQQAKTNLNKTAGNITDVASDTLNRAKNRLPGSKLAMDGSPHVSFSKPTKPLPQNSRQQNFWKETEAGKGDLARKLDGETGEGGSWFPTRIIDPIKDAAIIKRVSELKATLSNRVLNKSGANMGYAEVNIEGISKTEFFAHSQVTDHGKNPNLMDFSFKPLKPNKPKYEAQKAVDDDGIPYLRDDDTEYKIINDIALKLNGNYNAKGTIKLFTEKDTCASCNSIINKFKKDFPNIDIEVIHNNGNKIPKMETEGN